MLVRTFRAALKLMALVAWSAGLMIPACLVRFSGGRRIERGAWWTRAWARGCLRVLGVGVEVAGCVPEEKGGLIVSNHLGYLDILVHASIFKVRFAPKIEMKRWPLVGAMTSLSNPVWIDRSRRCRAGESAFEMQSALRGEVPLLVYPEGTSSNGDTLLPFKSTCFESALVCGCAIQPILTHYHTPQNGVVLPWFGDASLLPHIWRVLGLKAIRCQVYIMKSVYPAAAGRKELASQLHDAMELQYRRWIDNA